MNVDLIFKIAGIGIIVGILHTVLDKMGKQEYAYIATLAGVVIVLTMVIDLIGKLFDDVKVIFGL
ncbi:stage III sporulation protein AC [Gottschalkia acidurici 9a]|uniref:Stage III sporulation protein AC n=1 Tax=Gottschalkia acidurici (strain ATCC 7906 / DSM 604 / BCRC 14475 / CIP 104303 / KCTC 5404 / NCIMB 10678 / 9a) TaxID=1128398 RepID=K0AYR2_GOTA9|nr:stage III sporulation protein AC [Gottschalkia acidurici]AFS78384.1 stage III sporulation protein AC [Gottschalkia acidurici 9a]